MKRQLALNSRRAIGPSPNPYLGLDDMCRAQDMPLMFHEQFGLGLHAHALPNSKCLVWLGPRSGMRSPVSHKPLPLGMKLTCFCKKERARNEIKCVCSTCCAGLAWLFRFHAQHSVRSKTPESDEEEKWVRHRGCQLWALLLRGSCVRVVSFASAHSLHV